MLELQHAVTVLQEDPIVVALEVNHSASLTTIATGEDEQEAIKKAFFEMHETLDDLLRWEV